MKRILLTILMLGLCVNLFAADQWDKTAPAGTTSVSDLDTYIGTNNAALDRLLYLERINCIVLSNTVATLTVLPGTIALPNSDGSIVRWRRNTSNTTVTWADIDAGIEAVSTQYYIYALADTDATTFTITISTNSTTPTGATYYRKIGYFYNNASSNIVSVGNIKNGDVSNTIIAAGTTDISTSSTSYADMDDMVIYFVSTGRPVTITFAATVGIAGYVVIDIDGTDKIAQCSNLSANQYTPMSVSWCENLSAGSHTIKAQWKSTAGTFYQYGSTYAGRVLIANEQ